MKDYIDGINFHELEAQKYCLVIFLNFKIS